MFQQAGVFVGEVVGWPALFSGEMVSGVQRGLAERRSYVRRRGDTAGTAVSRTLTHSRTSESKEHGVCCRQNDRGGFCTVLGMAAANEKRRRDQSRRVGNMKSEKPPIGWGQGSFSVGAGGSPTGTPNNRMHATRSLRSLLDGRSGFGMVFVSNWFQADRASRARDTGR